MNVLMIGLLLLELANELIHNLIHELLGLLICAVIILHNVIHLKWHKKLFKGAYDFKRLANTFINTLLLISLVTLLISGIITSEDLFFFLGLESSPFLQRVHVAAAYWFMIFIGIHLGIHWTRFAKALPFSLNIQYTYLKWSVAFFIITFGIYAFFERNVGNKLFMKAAFDFWDFEDNASGFFIYTLSIIALFIILTHVFLHVNIHLIKKGLPMRPILLFIMAGLITTAGFLLAEQTPHQPLANLTQEKASFTPFQETLPLDTFAKTSSCSNTEVLVQCGPSY